MGRVFKTRSFVHEVSVLKNEIFKTAVALETFARFVDPAVVERVARRDFGFDELYVCERVCTVLFLDVVRFTSIAELQPLPHVMEMLKDLFSTVARLVKANDGTVGDYAGDEMMAFFNSPFDVSNHAEKAVITAIQIPAALKLLNKRWRETLSPTFPTVAVRIGVH